MIHQPKTPAKLVSIVIVNYNGCNLLIDCLGSVFAQSYEPIEVIVVDNGSTDGSVETVRREFPDVRVVTNAWNKGFAEGSNQGTSTATGEYVVLLNNDTIVDKLWLEKLVEMMERPDVGVATSRVITDGVPESYYEMNGTINYLGYNIMRQFTDLSLVFFAGGASLIFRKAVVGMPFIGEYFLYQEDVYLSWYMRLMGFTVVMAQESVVNHRGGASTKKHQSPLVAFYQERNRLLNCLLMYEPGTLLRLTPYFTADAATKTLLAVAHRRKSFKGIVSAYAWILGHRKWIINERKRIQGGRRVRDEAIMMLMSPNVLDSGSGFTRVVNWMSKAYARLAGLRYHA